MTASTNSGTDGRGAEQGVEPGAIVTELEVERPSREVFESFVSSLGQWWPLSRYSSLTGRTVEVHVERRLGGAVTEIGDDGSRREWGRLVAWEPGHRFALDWQVTPGLEQTVVTVSFRALGPRLTRVSVVHSGWQHVGRKVRKMYDGYRTGWSLVVESFLQYVERCESTACRRASR